MILWKFTAREVRRRPGRAALTLLSIAIGMAAVVSISLATATTRQAYREMYAMVAGRASLEVTAAGGGAFDQDLVAKLQAVPGVVAAVPSVQRFTVLYFQHERFRLLLLGIDPRSDAQVRDYQLQEGRFFDDGQGLLLEAGFAHGAGIHLGDEVKLLTPHGMKRLHVVGLLSPRGAAGFNKGGGVFASLETAQRLFLKPGSVNTIDVVTQDPDDPEKEKAVAAEIGRRLPVGLDVHPPTTRTQLAKESLVSIEQGLGFASVLTIVLAIFIVVNTFLMNVGERRRQLAILRAVGATRGQILRLLLGEGLFMGILGTVLGCLFGLAGGLWLMGGITRLFVATPPPVQLTVYPFALAAVLGPAIAVLGALIPALMTTRISPLEAMQPLVAADRAGVPWLMTVLGLLFTTVNGALLAACVLGWLPIAWSAYVGAMFMAFFVLVLPEVVGPMAWLISKLLSPLLGMEGRLAHRQILRRPTRTGLTIGVLYIAVCTGIGLGTTIINNVDDVKAWYRRTLQGDFFVRAMFPDVATGQATEVPNDVGDQIRQVPGITGIDTVRFLNARAAGHAVVVVAREFTDPRSLPLELPPNLNPDLDEVRRSLLADEVVVGTVLAQSRHLKVGDLIDLETSHGVQRLRIGGLAVDYMVGGYIVCMQRTLAERLFGVKGADAYLIQADPKARAAVGVRLAEICQRHGLMLHSFAELSQLLDAILAGVVGSLWGVLVLGLVVSAFGIANTLTMNVLEQTRELALLRVVAMTRRQVRKMVLAQAAIIGVIGLACGMAAGVNTAFIMSLCMMPLLGYPVPFLVHPGLLLGCFAVAMAFVLLAAWLPAARAARLDLLIALQYE